MPNQALNSTNAQGGQFLFFTARFINIQINKMALEGVFILIATPFLELTQEFKITVYCIVSFILIFICWLHCKERHLRVRAIILIINTIICVVFTIEAYLQTKAILLLFMCSHILQFAKISLPLYAEFTIASLNIYTVIRLLEYSFISFFLFALSMVIITLHNYLTYRQTQYYTNSTENSQCPNCNSYIKKPPQDPTINMLFPLPHTSIDKKPNKNWDSTYNIPDFQESLYFFNLIPEGFALINPENMQVQFCNQAALEIFHIAQKQEITECLENLQDVVVKTQKDIKTEHPECKDSLPSFRSFYPNYSGKQPLKNSRHKVSIQYSKRNVEEADHDNQLLRDLRSYSFDRRHHGQASNKQFNTIQIGIYLAYWSSNYGCNNLEQPNKRLLELQASHTTIEEKPTILLQIRDVTHRDYIRDVKQEHKAMSTGLAYVSHEYRQPLNCIIQMLKQLKVEVGAQQHTDYIKIALNNCQYLQNLSNDLLDLAQIRKGTFSITAEMCNLRQLIEECFDLFRFQMVYKNLQLRLDYRNHVPSQLNNDPKRIKQVLINLLGNAFKFTLVGYIELSVTKTGNNLLRVEVRDTGIGIKQEDQSKLLKAFSRISDAEHKHLNRDGVGLGLMISNILATKLNNSNKPLFFESMYQYGSSFGFFISLNIGERSELVEEICEGEEINSETPIRRNSLWRYVLTAQKHAKTKCQCIPILIVDDSSFNILVLKILIQKLKPNLKIACCLDGEQAVQMVQKDRCQKCEGYKVILMDINMGKLSGYDTTKIIKKQYPKIRIIGCSGFSSPNEQKQAFEAGMDSYLVKPIEMDDLKKLVDQIL